MMRQLSHSSIGQMPPVSLQIYSPPPETLEDIDVIHMHPCDLSSRLVRVQSKDLSRDLDLLCPIAIVKNRLHLTMDGSLVGVVLRDGPFADARVPPFLSFGETLPGPGPRPNSRSRSAWACFWPIGVFL